MGALGAEAASGLGIIFLLAGIVEVEKGDGDFDDPLDIQSKAVGTWGSLNDLRNKELAHGRLAMSTVATLWIFEYNFNLTPQHYLAQQLSPAALIALFALFLIWASWDDRKTSVA